MKATNTCRAMSGRSIGRKKGPSVQVGYCKSFRFYLLGLSPGAYAKAGFPLRWRDWIALMLSSASSSVLLNGEPGDHFWHMQGLRQGDPLSPLLFIITIDPLHHLLAAASDLGVLAPLPGRGPSLRVSLYTDDAVIFANPSAQEVGK